MNIFFFKLIFEVDGGWSNWNAWSPCSSPTGDGWRIRARTCSNPSPLNGGHDCVGLSFNSVACSLTPTFGLFPYSYLSLISSDISWPLCIMVLKLNTCIISIWCGWKILFCMEGMGWFFVVVIFNLFSSLFHNLYYFRGWGLELLGRMVILQCIVWGRSA